MATTKITDLTAYTDPVNTDVLPIVDVTSDVTKKVSIANVMKNASLGTAALPGIAFDGDPNTGIYSPGADQVAVTTGGTQRLLIDSAGAVTIAGDLTVNGTTTNINTTNLVIEDKNIILGDVTTPTDVTADGGGITLKGATDKTINWVDSTDAWTSSERFSYPLGSAAAPTLTFTGDANTGIYSPGADQVAISTNGLQRATIDNAGRLLVGATTTSADARVVIQGRSANAASNASLFLQRGTTGADAGSGSVIGEITFAGSDSSDFAKITCTGDAATSANDYPGRLVFSTTADGSATPTERMRLDSSGRLGIGTTTPSDALQVASGNILIGTNGSSAGYRALYFGSSSTASARFAYIEKNNDSPFDFNIVAQSSTTASSAINFKTTPISTAATIDSSGRLLVGTPTARALAGQTAQSLLEGTTTPTSSLAAVCNANSTAGPLLLLGKSRGTAAGGTTAVAEGDRLGAIFFTGANGTDLSNIGALIDCVVDAEPFTSGDTTDLPSRLMFSTTADGASSPTERVRIASNGITYIGNTTITTSSQQTTAPHAIIYSNGSSNVLAAGGLECNTTSTSARHHISFTNPNGVVGSISTSASATAYNTSSDYRLKENVVPLTGAADRLNQLQVHRFNFIADSGRTVDGFIAHEAQAIVPECVTGEKDAVDDEGNPVYQGIDQSKLVPLLTAALQEAMERIEALEAKVAALEGA